MNIRCLALTEEQYRKSVALMRDGFYLEGAYIKPNIRMATICVLEAVLGIRIGDVLDLRLTSFVKDGDRYRLNIVEQKTGKDRRFTVPIEIYSFIQGYALERSISPEAKLFEVSARQVQRYVSKVFKYMGLSANYSTHSFRKYFATSVYYNSNGDVALVQTLLQHSSISTTQKYLVVGDKRIEDALGKTVAGLV